MNGSASSESEPLPPAKSPEPLPLGGVPAPEKSPDPVSITSPGCSDEGFDVPGVPDEGRPDGSASYHTKSIFSSGSKRSEEKNKTGVKWLTDVLKSNVLVRPSFLGSKPGDSANSRAEGARRSTVNKELPVFTNHNQKEDNHSQITKHAQHIAQYNRQSTTDMKRLYSQRLAPKRQNTLTQSDPTADDEEQEEEFKSWEKLVDRIPVLSVFSVAAQAIVVLVLTVSSWTCFMVPLWLAFPERRGLVCIFERCLPPEGELKWLDHIADVVYLLCALAHFFIAFLDDENKEEVLVFATIFQYRITSVSLWMDVLTCLPLSVGHSPFVALLKFLRIQHLIKTSVTFQHLQFHAAVQISRLVAMVLYGAHLVATVWLYSILQSDALDYYVDSGLTVNVDTLGYLMALRDATFMMVNRPVKAHTDSEMIICILMAPIGAVVVAIFFGSVNWLFQRLNMRAMQNYEELSTVRQVLKLIVIPAHVRARVINYYRYTQIHDYSMSCDMLFNRVSPTLKLELKFYLYADLLAETPFFSDVNSTIMKALVLELDLCIYATGDFVICKHESAESMYFISKGRTEVLIELDQEPVCIFEQGRHFGEMALYRSVEANAKRTAWVRAVSYCHLARLTRASFEDILDEFPSEAEQLLDKIGDTMESKDWNHQRTSILNGSQELNGMGSKAMPRNTLTHILKVRQPDDWDASGTNSRNTWSSEGSVELSSVAEDLGRSTSPTGGEPANEADDGSPTHSSPTNVISVQRRSLQESSAQGENGVRRSVPKMTTLGPSLRTNAVDRISQGNAESSHSLHPPDESASGLSILRWLVQESAEQREELAQHTRLLVQLLEGQGRDPIAAGLASGPDHAPTSGLEVLGENGQPNSNAPQMNRPFLKPNGQSHARRHSAQPTMASSLPRDLTGISHSAQPTPVGSRRPSALNVGNVSVTPAPPSRDFNSVNSGANGEFGGDIQKMGSSRSAVSNHASNAPQQTGGWLSKQLAGVRNKRMSTVVAESFVSKHLDTANLHR